MRGPPHLSLVLLHVNLVSEDHEREILGIMRAGLDQELVAPTVQSLERLGAVHVVHEHAAVCTTVECDAEGLEALLASSIPQLREIE